MSFYLDDHDDDEPRYSLSQGLPLSQRPAQSSDDYFTDHDNDGFVCHNCGGTESYLDDNTGGLVCVDCFTQSQTMIAASQEQIDYDDTMVLAGRASGRLQGRKSRLSLGVQKRKRKRLEEIDQSTTLPDAEICIMGFQRILKESTRIVANLISCPRAVEEAAMETCRNVWIGYLSSWFEGAEFYGKIYPEVRFCFRDKFLPLHLRKKVLRTLAYNATKKIRSELTNDTKFREQITTEMEKDEKEGTKEPDEFTIEFIDGDNMSEYVPDDQTTNSENQTKTAQRNPIDIMIQRHQKLTGAKTLGRKSVALMLSPSLNMAAAILCLAFAPCGVTISNIERWIESGDLPLINAFPLLTYQQRKQLKLIKPFFRNSGPPSARALEKIIPGIQVASGWQPKKIMVRTRKLDKYNILLEESEHLTHDQNPTRIFTPRSVPLVLARTVAQLGFSQKVLMFAFAFMGLPIPDCKELKNLRFLPKPIKACRPDKVTGMPQVLSVIVLASKLVTRWQDHRYELPYQPDMGPVSTKTPTVCKAIIWEEEESRRLGLNRPDALLDMIENHFMEPENAVLMNTVDDEMLQSVTSVESSPIKEENCRTKIVVRPSLTAFQRLLPKSNIDQPQKFRGMPIEISNVGLSVKEEVPPAPLGTLIEYVAIKTGTDPREVLRCCRALDKEVDRKATQRRRRREFRKKAKKSEPAETIENAKENGWALVALPSWKDATKNATTTKMFPSSGPREKEDTRRSTPARNTRGEDTAIHKPTTMSGNFDSGKTPSEHTQLQQEHPLNESQTEDALSTNREDSHADGTAFSYNLDLEGVDIVAV